MAGTAFNIDFNLETRRSQLCRSKPGRHWWDGLVVFAVYEQHRCVVAGAGDLLWRKQTRKGDQRTDLPTTRSDCIQPDDGTLRDADEGDPIAGPGKTFPVDNVGNKNIEGLSRAFNSLWVKRVAVCLKPLMSGVMMHRSVR